MSESYWIRQAKKGTGFDGKYWTGQHWSPRFEDAYRYPSYERCSRIDSETIDYIEVKPEVKKETPNLDDDKKITAKLDAIKALVGVTQKVEEPDYALLYAKFMLSERNKGGLYCLSYEKSYPCDVFHYYLDNKENLWTILDEGSSLAYLMYSRDWEVQEEKERHLIDELLRKRVTS